jgi:basic membrane protein A
MRTRSVARWNPFSGGGVNTTARIAAMVGIACLTLAGCGDRPSNNADTSPSTTPSATESSSAPAEQHPDFKACMVSDSGGFDDKSFNQTSLKGQTDAVTQLGVKQAKVESSGDSEYADNIAALVKQKCNEITTVGFNLGDATLAAAKKSPKIDFAIVDNAFFDDKGNNIAPKNLKALTFDTGQPSYLAGYLAAAKSQTGIVGTFGGQNIPTVTIFMTGFAQGVAKYNEDNGKDVKVIGWDPVKKTGSFTDDFESKPKGQAIAEQLIQQGADVILPVAGPAGLGGLQAAKDRNVKAIWVDTDGCVSASEYCDVMLTSVVKSMDVAVTQAIKDAVDGNFSNELYLGTLENGGVSLAPYPPAAGIDADLSGQIDALKQDIIDGKIKVG